MCPNINLLKSYKVYPRQTHFNYLKDLYFIYVYLNPFAELKQPMEVKTSEGTFCFAYLPIYVGKGTGSGYRQNQHIQAFLRGNENNILKKAAFEHLKDEMAKAASMGQKDKPWNWKEYQNSYVIILKTFDDPKKLIDFEISLIKQIGTVWDKTGPLTNKIKNVNKYDFVTGTGKTQVF
jgi:hypothetical protein